MPCRDQIVFQAGTDPAQASKPEGRSGLGDEEGPQSLIANAPTCAPSRVGRNRSASR